MISSSCCKSSERKFSESSKRGEREKGRTHQKRVILHRASRELLLQQPFEASYADGSKRFVEVVVDLAGEEEAGDSF